MAITYLSGERIQGNSTAPNKTVLIFNSSGSFTPTESFDVEYLVIGGGAGGGRNNGGGGGAGAYRTATGLGVTAQAYTVTVGAGGTGNTSSATAQWRDGDSTTGGDSVFSTITSEGGGGGGGEWYPGGGSRDGYANGNASSGGGGNNEQGGSSGAYGYDGGDSPNNHGGGGGGSSAVGQDSYGGNSGGYGGNGGAGTASSISGSSVTRAGGGGGAAQSGTGGTGGSGGGGNGGGSNTAGSNATANTGSGGGGGQNANGGAGGSGVVILSFAGGKGYSTTGSPTVVNTTQDDKATITNVPAGTRFEETDTRTIFRREVGALDNDTGLRFHYKFDEASGDVINNGSVASADLTVTNLTRDAATPSGLGNGMSTPNNSTGYAQNTSRVNDYKFMHDGTAKWSVTFWFYATDLPDSAGVGTESMIMGNVWTDDNGIGWALRFAYDQSPTSTTTARFQTLVADGNAGMILNDQSANGFVPDLNAWHFYCVTYDPDLGSNNLTVTRDAATSGTGFHQADTDNETWSSSNPTRKVVYMARPTGSYDMGAIGRLAQVTIWEDRILTQAEKVALYSSGNGTTKLTSSWKEKGSA